MLECSIKVLIEIEYSDSKLLDSAALLVLVRNNGEEKEEEEVENDFDVWHPPVNLSLSPDAVAMLHERRLRTGDVETLRLAFIRL